MALTNGTTAAEAEAKASETTVTPKGRERVRLVERVRAKPKRAKEQSSISFPYKDLDTGVSVAQAMLQAGGVALTPEQLAGVMNLQPGTGNFVAKVSTARVFGLIASNQGKYELTMLGFAVADNDEKRQKAAKAEAFLAVPLYRRTYDEFKGKQLPPRPGLEQAFVRFGVAAKQKTAARLAFDKSAAQAGFFSAGPDRLIEPIIGGAPGAPVTASDDRVRAVSDAATTGPDVSGFHPFIQGLLDTLPAPDTNWAVEGRAKWLMAANNIFDLIYKGTGSIEIIAKPAPDKS